MPTNPHEIKLLGLIDDVLAGDLAFDQYETAYKDYYIERMPEGAFTDWSRREFFSEAHELLDWTDEHPDAESRRYGWRDRTEYLEWLRTSRADWFQRFGTA